MKPKYIICENKAERDAVLKKLDGRGYVWISGGEKPTKWNYNGWKDDEAIYFNISHGSGTISWGGASSDSFSDEPEKLKITAQKFLNNDRPILITRKGRVVTAEDKNTGEKATAVCSPDDTFDFGTGAMIAVARLIAQSDKGITKDAETVLRQLLGDDVNNDTPAEEEPTTKFKIGDLVTLKEGVKEGDYFGHLTVEYGAMFDQSYHKPIKVIETSKTGSYLCVPAKGNGTDFYYHEEMLEPWDESKIREGDIVRVINTGLNYSAYPQWVGEHISDPYTAARYCYSSPNTESKYKVLKIAEHEYNGRMLAFIEECNGFGHNKCYLVEVKGLEKVTE